MPLFGRRVDPAEQQEVLALLRAIFQGNAKIDTAKNVALQCIVREPRGMASPAFEEARRATLEVLNALSAQVRDSAFWPVLDDPQGVRIMVELREVLEECHRHQLIELHTMGSAAEAFRSGAEEGPTSLDEIKRSQQAFNKSLDKLGRIGGKLARRYEISHKELQSFL